MLESRSWQADADGSKLSWHTWFSIVMTQTPRHHRLLHLLLAVLLQVGWMPAQAGGFCLSQRMLGGDCCASPVNGEGGSSHFDQGAAPRRTCCAALEISGDEKAGMRNPAKGGKGKPCRCEHPTPESPFPPDAKVQVDLEPQWCDVVIHAASLIEQLCSQCFAAPIFPRARTGPRIHLLLQVHLL